MTESSKLPRRTYVPGYAKAKSLLLLLGLALMAAGALQLSGPLRSIISGGRAVAEVSRVIVLEPGFAPVLHDTPREYQQDLLRRQVYGYEVRIPGEPASRTLNLRNRVRPQLQIGDAVRVTWNEGEPAAYAILDLRTWAVGAFLLIPGAVFTVAFIYLFRYARKPIELPDDIPADIEL